MTDKINGRTPEEIKRGLECCTTVGSNCNDCPYEGECLLPFGHDPESDALALIQQLERERDAAVEDLSENRKCETCKYYTPGYFCIGCRRGDQWQWRGVQEVG